ncbi:hypothetical protein [Geodermatophilus nigrescens]|uniref:Uncharacterized protein n=1 Tax=Geodermatophilus nigrescens TaxID=1070870 RepID=A0A1M5G4J5_9ACTN|nr:hypothetical protein [Geodermatophilus nigrescens]SHF98740.1 hypothetical protein SAMN05444351_1548 [Geodermatophilus nigrescens]
MHAVRATTIGVLTAGTALLTAGTAVAAPPERGVISDTSTTTFTDFCGEPGLTVSAETHVEARYSVAPRRAGGLLYFMQHGTVEESLSVVAADGTVLRADVVTSTSRVLEKDLLVTDLGRGRLLVDLLATGNATTYGSDGKAIARNPGQVRFQLVIDAATGEVLEDRGLTKGSTGRTDDFCAAVVPELLG